MVKKRESAALQRVLPPELEEALAEAISPIEAAPARLAAVRSVVLDRVRSDKRRFVTVRYADGNWMPLTPNIAYKMLDDDGAMQAFLLKFDPGARLPAHDHHGDEMCVVLEGSVRLGDVEVSAGDYHMALSSSHHGDLVSDSGAVLFIRTASGVIPHAPMR